jgi:hypothetical protein
MEDSLYNTPPCWTIYMCGLVFEHMLAGGGLPATFERNKTKAALIYDAIAAAGGFYAQPVAADCRSLMNIPFTIPAGEDLEKKFIAEAAKEGMVGSLVLQSLIGHKWRREAEGRQRGGWAIEGGGTPCRRLGLVSLYRGAKQVCLLYLASYHAYGSEV